METKKPHPGLSTTHPSPAGRGDDALPSPSGRRVGDEGPSHPTKPALPPELLERCRELRQSATTAESLLWQIIRNRQLGGAKFRRQHPTAGYILDFYCHEAQLAVELDGRGHLEEKQMNYDMERTMILNALGVRVLRFWNHEVLNNTTSVLEVIYAALLETQVLR